MPAGRRPWSTPAVTTRPIRPESWKLDAACISVPEMFDPEMWTNDNVAEARAICATCPVIPGCEKYAQDTKPTWGVWAGREWFGRHDGAPKTDAMPL